MAQFFLKILFFELNHDARSNYLLSKGLSDYIRFANSSSTYISSVKSICLIHPYEKLKKKIIVLKLQHVYQVCQKLPKNLKIILTSK